MIAVAAVEGLHWWRHVDEPNARVRVDFTLLSPNVNATIKTVHVKRGDRVKKGALLASMDTAVAGFDVDTLEAEIAKEKANRAQVEAELAQYQREMNDKIATATAAVGSGVSPAATFAIWTAYSAMAPANISHKARRRHGVARITLTRMRRRAWAMARAAR